MMLNVLKASYSHIVVQLVIMVASHGSTLRFKALDVLGRVGDFHSSILEPICIYIRLSELYLIKESGRQKFQSKYIHTFKYVY